MAEVVIAPGSVRFGATERQDLWWLPPLAVFLGLSAFVVYATVRVILNAHYVIDNETSAYILSPFYSPLILWEGMPTWLSPGFLVLWAPAGFRLTCYYYRKAYYRAFALDPAACAVSEPRRKNWKGETGLLIVQNLHRYFMYLALAFIVVLAIDAVHGFIWPDGFGISVASLVLVANTTLLSLYTFSCHSLRHLIGGKVDCFSCVAMGHSRQKLWKGVSKLNTNHMLWAWTSLFMVMFADLYVWMVSSGVWTDLRIL